MAEALVPMFAWSYSINSLEIACEMTVVIYAYSIHDFLHTQLCCLQKKPGLLHPHMHQVLDQRLSSVLLEQVPQPRG